MSVFWDKVNRKIDYLIYKRGIFDKEYLKPNSIFDYNGIIQHRPSAYIENCPANVMYGMGYALRKYSGYKGRIYCSTEHAMPSRRINNESEYRDFDGPIVLLSGDDRRNIVAPLTDKLCFKFGPNFVPYTDSIYSDFDIETMKISFGKTIVVFPQHNNSDGTYEGFYESTMQQIEYIKNLQKEHGYKTVIACVYYVDIERGMAHLYEEQGWIVVSAGFNKNYDFGRYLRPIFALADLVIVQGITGVAYATYWKKPVIYYHAQENLVRADGSKTPEWDWVVPIRMELEERFGDYHDEISQEQYDYANMRWGMDQVQTPENMKLILEFAKEIRKTYKDDKKVLKAAAKPKYAPIRDQIEDAVKIRRESKNVQNN